MTKNDQNIAKWVNTSKFDNSFFRIACNAGLPVSSIHQIIAKG